MIVILSKDNPSTRRGARRVLSLRPAWPTYQGVEGRRWKGRGKGGKTKKEMGERSHVCQMATVVHKASGVVSHLTDTTFATEPQRRAHFASVFHLLFSSLWLTGGWDVGLVLIFVSQCLKIIYHHIPNSQGVFSTGCWVSPSDMCLRFPLSARWPQGQDPLWLL